MMNDFPPEFTYLLKVILVGDSHTGKSCLLHRLMNGTFDSDQDITIGVDFGTKYIPIQNEIIKFQIWDTAGQECFAPIVRSYYKNIVGIFFMIDLTSKKSIKNIDFWLDEFNSNRLLDCKTIISPESLSKYFL